MKIRKITKKDIIDELISTDLFDTIILNELLDILCKLKSNCEVYLVNDSTYIIYNS